MELVERYLQSVKFWLPQAQRDDIAAELSEDLYTRIEERARELGGALPEDEVVSILRHSGPPVVVASRYRPQLSLIGPLLFPVYLFVLKIAGICYLLPLLLTLVGAFSFVPPAWTWTSFLGNIVPSAFVTFGVITIVFGVIERSQQKMLGALQGGSSSLFGLPWDPRKLPPLRNARRIARSSSIAEIIANFVFAIWCVSGMWAQTVFSISGVRIVLSNEWRVFYWAFLFLAAANVTAALVNLWWPYWTRKRITLRLALDCAGSILFCWLLKVGLVAAINGPTLSSARATEIVHLLNNALALSFPFAVVTCVLIVVLTDLRRLWILRPGKTDSLPPFGLRPSV